MSAVDSGTVRPRSGRGAFRSDQNQGDVFVAFRPSVVALYHYPPEGSPRNVWHTTIAGIQHHGDNLRVELDGPCAVAADITPDAAAQLRLAPGEQIWASVKAVEIRAYPTGRQ
jgi:molybdate transport system ATP-binding protein